MPAHKPLRPPFRLPKGRRHRLLIVIAILVMSGALVAAIVLLAKVWPGPQGKPASGEKESPLSLPRELLGESSSATLESKALDQTVLAEAKDNAPVEELPFYYLLKKASALTGDESLEAKLDVEALLRRPGSLRGKLVELVGTVYKLYDYELDDNPSGIRHVYQGELGDSSYQLFTTVCTEPPAGIKAKDTVRARGYFLKIRSYEDREGRGRTAPVLVAKKLVLIDASRTYRRGNIFVIMLTLFCLGLVVLGYVLWLGWRRRPIVFQVGRREGSSGLPEEKGKSSS